MAVCVRYIALAFAVAILAPIISAVAWAQSQDEASWLIVLQGEITRISTGELEIATGRRGLAFTDRPDRTVRFVDISEFVDAAWSDGGGFRTVPPNASLVNENNESIAILTISSASWSGGNIQMNVSLLEGDPPLVGDYVALTIDGLPYYNRFLE